MINETKFTMAIDFNSETGLCKMIGNSYPEDAISFFEPLNKWLNLFINNVKKPILFEIQLNYLNSSSSKCFMDIFDLLEEYSQDGGSVKVKWVFQEDDDEIREAGEELLEDMSFEYEYVELKD